MSYAAYYRSEARRCRQMAGTARTVTTSRRWAELADDYEQLAASLERRGRTRMRHLPMRQQVQQQQSRQEPEQVPSGHTIETSRNARGA